MKKRLPATWILAGGLGTRLAAVVPDRPKALALIGDRPFLDIVFDQLLAAGIERVVLLLGARHEAILRFLDERKARRPGAPELQVETSIEPSPLGTGGAVKFAERFATEPFFLLNGDTYLDFNPMDLVARHEASGALVTLAASHQQDTRRFGQLELTNDGFVSGFREKADSTGAGYINGGVYLVEPSLLELIPEGRPVSLEQETFPLAIATGKRMAALPQSGDFFDIGTPESYRAFLAYLAKTSG
jgi:NDP-sugar pyrophosphorylase family protein